MTQDNERTKITDTNIVLRILTIFVWIIFGLALLWIIVIFVWFLLDLFGFGPGYMPKDIQSSTVMLLIAFIWATIIGIIFYCFAKRHKSKLKAQAEFLNENIHSYPWTEILFTPSEAKSNHLIRQKVLSSEELSNLTSSRLLSYGIALYNQGMITEATGIFRLVIERSDSTPLLIKIAEYRLYQLVLSMSAERSKTYKLEEGR